MSDGTLFLQMIEYVNPVADFKVLLPITHPLRPGQAMGPNTGAQQVTRLKGRLPWHCLPSLGSLRRLLQPPITMVAAPAAPQVLLVEH